MKKMSVLALAAAAAFASCTNEKQEAQTPVTLPKIEVAVPAAAELAAKKLDTEREWLAFRAALYAKSLADSLVSTETMGNGKYDLGKGFPSAIRAIEAKFATNDFRVAAGFEVDMTSEEIAVTSRVAILDTLGRKTTYLNAKKQ